MGAADCKMQATDPPKKSLFSDEDDAEENLFSAAKKEEVFSDEILSEAIRRRKLREPGDAEQPKRDQIQWQEDEAQPAGSSPLVYRVEAVEGKGRGVVAARDIQSGELVEMAHCITIPATQTIDIQSTVLRDYVFAAPNGGCLLALGVGSLFNHSDTPNLEIWMDPSQAQIQFMATGDLKEGTELTIRYTHLPKGYDFTEKSADCLNPFEVAPPQSPLKTISQMAETPTLCESFSIKGFCAQGSRCHFVHEEQRKTKRSVQRSSTGPRAAQSKAPSCYGASYTIGGNSSSNAAFSL